MSKLFFFILFLGVIVTSCSNNEEKPVRIAEVEGQELLIEDFERYAFMRDIDPSDSLAKKRFVNNWINKTIINLEAKENFPDEYYHNQKKAEEILYELNLFSLENNYIKKGVDTTITEAQIFEYFFKQNPVDEKPKQLVKALYVKMPDSLKQADTMKTAYLLKSNKDTSLVNKIGKLYGSVFYFEKNKWMSLDQLVRELPLSEEKKNDLFVKKGAHVFELEGYLYFLNIFKTQEYIKETKISEIQKTNIKKHLLNQRINELRSQTHEEIIKNASQKYSIIRY